MKRTQDRYFIRRSTLLLLALIFSSGDLCAAPPSKIPAKKPGLIKKSFAPVKPKTPKAAVTVEKAATWPAAKPKSASAKWPSPPKAATNDVLVIEGGVVGADGSVTVGGSSDEAPAHAAPVVKTAPSQKAAPAKTTVAAVGTPPTPSASTDPSVTAETSSAAAAPLSQEAPSAVEASTGGEEVALDFGADVESGFNPYLFERNLGWMLLPLFALIILGLHLMPVPKRKMKKLVAQTDLFKGLPGKENTGAAIQIEIQKDEEQLKVAAVQSNQKPVPTVTSISDEPTAQVTRPEKNKHSSLVVAPRLPAAKAAPSSVQVEADDDADGDGATRLYVAPKKKRND